MSQCVLVSSMFLSSIQKFDEVWVWDGLGVDVLICKPCHAQVSGAKSVQQYGSIDDLRLRSYRSATENNIAVEHYKKI